MQNDFRMTDFDIQSPNVINGVVIIRFNAVSKYWVSVVRNNGRVACRTHSVREKAIKNAYKAIS